MRRIIGATDYLARILIEPRKREGKKKRSRVVGPFSDVKGHLIGYADKGIERGRGYYVRVGLSRAAVLCISPSFSHSLPSNRGPVRVCNLGNAYRKGHGNSRDLCPPRPLYSMLYGSYASDPGQLRHRGLNSQ